MRLLSVVMALLVFAPLQFNSASHTSTGVQHKVKCSTDAMTVEMILPETVTDVYLEGMKEYGKEIGCQPTLDGSTASFRLPIVDFYRCGLTKVVDNTNGHRVYYHRIVVESDGEKEAILVKCGWMPQKPTAASNRTKRADELSPDFQEETEYDITVIESHAPEPFLGIAVRQNGQLVGSDLNVQPGTLLQMDVFLDPNSTSIYGLRVSYMDVTDRRTKEETIILNGCSVDPYLFENFNTVDNGDTLTARFRAFKFPETNFVLFRGTIDVCLDKCSGVECSNDQLAYGRKRRSTDDSASMKKTSFNRKDRVFEVSMTTLVKFDAETTLTKDVLKSEAARGADDKEAVSRAAVEARSVDTVEQPIQSQQSQSLLNEAEESNVAAAPAAAVHQAEPSVVTQQQDSSSSSSAISSFHPLCLFSFFFFFYFGSSM